MSAIRSLRTSTLVSVPVNRLRTGAVLQFAMVEDHPTRNTELLAAGTRLTADRLAVLTDRGVLSVRVERSEVDDVTIDARDRSTALREAQLRAASIAERQQDNPWGVNADSLLHHVRPRGTESYDTDTRAQFRSRFGVSVQRIGAMFEALALGETPDADDLLAITSDSLVQLTDDLDLFVTLGLTPVVDDYPSKHSVQTAMLAMSIGTRLGLRRSELLEMGIGCLVHDAGMLHLDPRIVGAEDQLDKVRFLEITKHPIITYDLMQKVDSVPLGARMVAYQMHERCDGSGYPRGRSSRQIHPLARIAAVADVYIALVSPRPHRPGLKPYDAILVMLDGARRGLYDRHAVRGLLETVSLFPVGSGIETTDGRKGRVLRATADYTRPVVELLGGDAPSIVDLSSDDLRIARAIDADEIEVPTEIPAEADSADYWE